MINFYANHAQMSQVMHLKNRCNAFFVHFWRTRLSLRAAESILLRVIIMDCASVNLLGSKCTTECQHASIMDNFFWRWKLRYLATNQVFKLYGQLSYFDVVFFLNHVLPFYNGTDSNGNDPE